MPYRDEGIAAIFQTGDRVIEMADTANGQNRVQRGQFQKGNKTRFEFESTMSNSSNRLRMAASFIETAFMQPIKYQLKLNVLQYQPPASLYNRQTKEPIRIDPTKLRETAWELQIADGQMPVDKMMNPEEFNTVFNFAAANPVAASEYDLMGIFAHSMELRGAGWVNDFKRTEQQKAQYLQQTQAQNGIPTTGGPATPQ